MSLRQKINDKPALTAVVTGAVVVLLLIVLFYELFGGRSRTSGASKDFYSDDDGQTYFLDDAKKHVPFTDSNGKSAVRAIVYQCGSDKPFVAYLQQFSDEAQTQPQLKKPGDKAWLSPTQGAAFDAVTNVKCPKGGSQDLHVLPAAGQ